MLIGCLITEASLILGENISLIQCHVEVPYGGTWSSTGQQGHCVPMYRLCIHGFVFLYTHYGICMLYCLLKSGDEQNAYHGAFYSSGY